MKTSLTNYVINNVFEEKERVNHSLKNELHQSHKFLKVSKIKF